MIPEHQDVSINFSIRWTAPFGKAVYIAGNVAELGQWQPCRAQRLRFSYGNNWNTTIKMPKYQQIQYKFFITNFDWVDTNNIQWQSREANRVLSLKQCQDQIFPSISMCSFNIKMLTDKDQGSNHWDSRKQKIRQYFLQNHYDFIGIQQASLAQRKFLQQAMDSYQYYGKQRRMEEDQQCGIFVKKNKFIVIEDHYDWISQQRQEDVAGYDAQVARYFTTLLVAPRFFSSKQGKMPCLLFANAHLDNLGILSRKKGIEQILQRCLSIKKYYQKSESYQLVSCAIMGDFNESQTSSYFDIIRKCEQMPFKSMRQIQGADNRLTFNGFQNKYLLKFQSLIANTFLTIDHIFYWIKEDFGLIPTKFQVGKTKSGEYMSDHYPVVCQIKADPIKLQKKVQMKI